MPIEFRCPSCSKLLRTPDESAGKKAKCPQCAAIVDVPLASEPASPFPAPTPIPPSVGSAHPNSNPFTDGGNRGGGASPDINSNNPYATFGAAPALVPFAGNLSKVPPRHTLVTFDDLWSGTWSFFSTRIGPFALFGIVFLVVSIAIGAPFNFIFSYMQNLFQQRGERVMAAVAYILGQIVGTVVQALITAGLTNFVVRTVRTGEVKLNNFFAGMASFLPVLGIMLVQTLILFGSLVVFALPVGLVLLVVGINNVQGNPAPVVITGIVMGLCYVAVVIWVSLRLILSVYFLVDDQRGVIQSISDSWQYMRGNVMSAFLIYMVIGLLGGLFTCFTCGIGLVFYVPYVGLLGGMTYFYATGQMAARNQNAQL